MIYVMYEPATDRHKIGEARDEYSARRERLPDIRRRLSRARGERVTIEFVLWVAWPPSAEQQIHRYLWRLWVGDEWFSRGPELELVLGWLLNHGYFAFQRAFHAAESSLPPPWHWKSRDRILRSHRAALEPI